MNLKRFRIGEVVSVTALLVTRRDPSTSRKSLELEVIPQRRGVIVGAARRYEGEVSGGVSYRDDDPPHLRISKTVYVWLVRFGLLNRPEPVLDEDVISIERLKDTHDPNWRLPILANAYRWEQEDRQLQREWVRQHQRRDAHGRWITEKAG